MTEPSQSEGEGGEVFMLSGLHPSQELKIKEWPPPCPRGDLGLSLHTGNGSSVPQEGMRDAKISAETLVLSSQSVLKQHSAFKQQRSSHLGF